jgi:hypothetical protein
MKNRTNLQETVGNEYTSNVQNCDLIEPWREQLLIWRMDFDQKLRRAPFKKLAFPLVVGWKIILVSKHLLSL